MTCVNLSSPEEQIKQLQEKLRQFTLFALEQEEWEAQILSSDGDWFDMMPEDLRTKLDRVQQLRNKALSP